MVIEALFCARFCAKHLCKQHVLMRKLRLREVELPKQNRMENSGLSYFAQEVSPGPTLKNKLQKDLGQILGF